MQSGPLCISSALNTGCYYSPRYWNFIRMIQQITDLFLPKASWWVTGKFSSSCGEVVEKSTAGTIIVSMG
jgi:hypothetical protein